MFGLSKDEEKLFKKLNTPIKIQDYLDSISINHEKGGETLMSPRLVMKNKKAHCLEGALLAGAILYYHGEKPLILDLKTPGPPTDYDHVVTLFKKGGFWGAISKTNHPVLRYRDPIFKSVRELANSYFHEYFIDSGKKTLKSYSKPFDLSRLGDYWITSEKDLWEIEDKLDNSEHFRIFPPNMKKHIRKASVFERVASKREEWPRNLSKNKIRLLKP